MSRILLVIGLSSAKATAEPELVYLGRSGDAMRTAMAAAPHPRFLIVPHVQGIPKNNSRAAINAAAADAAELAEQALESATVEQLRADLAARDADLAARDAELAELRAKLALVSPALAHPPGTPPLPPQRPK